MKIVTIIGARPQFIKASAVSRVIRYIYSKQIQEILVHTGQHSDDNMSKIFFKDLDIPEPKYNFGISGGQHGSMTGRMLEAIENVLLTEKPDCLLVYGDTNSTLAGALAAIKLHIPIAHVEAGLRSYNMNMPEEINRILADRVSTFLFCPTDTAVHNLKSEMITKGVHYVGDVMYDVALFYRDLAIQQSNILQRLNLTSGNFVLATCHRAENTDIPERLKEILFALSTLSSQFPVILPLHPRTVKAIHKNNFDHYLQKIIVVEPLSFIDMIALEQSAHVIITDSGGVQKEAFFYKVPCITIRDETEWIETIESSWNQLVGADSNKIIAAASNLKVPNKQMKPYGDGQASQKIIDQLLKSK